MEYLFPSFSSSIYRDKSQKEIEYEFVQEVITHMTDKAFKNGDMNAYYLLSGYLTRCRQDISDGGNRSIETLAMLVTMTGTDIEILNKSDKEDYAQFPLPLVLKNLIGSSYEILGYR